MKRVAMLSVHTSPLDQPGTGDAGGMNVYVIELAKQLADLDTAVEVFTRATSSELPDLVEVAPGVSVRHVSAGPYEGLAKEDLPGQLCTFARELLRVEAQQDLGWYDLIHSHYWLSGQVGALAADRWGIPLVHSMHTMAKVKNRSLALGDAPEPPVRVIGEEQVVAAADRLVASTEDEARDLIGLYDADPSRVAVVPPGVDLDTFGPGGPGAALLARRRLGLPADADVLLFVGRIQPLKAPDVLLRAVERMLVQEPWRRDRLVVSVVGGPSGSGVERPEELQKLAGELGISDVVSFHPPASRPVLADWYRAADLVAVPSFSESFGLVAVEAQACGTPVVAADVGGLRTVVRDGETGLLVPGHDPGPWSRALAALVDAPDVRDRMAAAAWAHARRFSWDATVDSTLDVYRAAAAGAPARLASRRLVVAVPAGDLAVAP